MSNQAPLSQNFLPWFSDHLCRSHAQFFCSRCIDEYRSPDGWNTNDFPHPAPEIARFNARNLSGPPSQLLHDHQHYRNRQRRRGRRRRGGGGGGNINVRVRWTGEDRSIQLIDPEATLGDILRTFDADGLRVDVHSREGRFCVPGVPLSMSLGEIVEGIGGEGEVMLVMERVPWC